MVDLSIFVEIHKVQFLGFEDVLQERLKIDKRGNFNENKLSFSERRTPELYYFMKAADIFPVDIDINSKCSSLFHQRLRPEFVVSSNHPLSSDAFMNNIESVESEKDDIEVAQAGKTLRTRSIDVLLRTLDSLNIIPIDSLSLTQVLHNFNAKTKNLLTLGISCSWSEYEAFRKSGRKKRSSTYKRNMYYRDDGKNYQENFP